MKKSITLVTGSEQTKIALLKQLREYLPGSIFINSYATEEGINNTIKDDLIVISSELVKNDLIELNVLDNSCDIMIAKRTINYDLLDQIVLIPPNTDVLFVNDAMECTYEGIEVLHELGIDHINYIPYYPEMNKSIKKVNIAVTPGEVDKVPSFVDKTYDIGVRIMDFTTIMEILNKLGILDKKIDNFSQKYLKKIINVAKRLAKSTNKISKLNDHLNLVINRLNDGLLVYDNLGNISVLNENLRKILKIQQSNAIGKSIKNIIFDKILLEFLMENTNEKEKVFNIDGVDVLVNKIYISQANSFVVGFKNVEDTIEANKKLRRELVKKGFYAKYTFEDIVGNSEAIKKVKAISKKLSKSELTILIEGESGTGKELFASSIHMESKRKKEAFLAVNFSALPDELIESELFGYEEGSFTGAKKGGKAGLFEQADGGTIFLDEIGDISLKVQARLLRVLQEKEVMRIGGVKIRPIDVRIVAATNKDLLQMVKEKKFREDLYYRLKMGYVNLPPLRKRKEDIYSIMNHFIKIETTEGIKICDDVIYELLKYDWYGNVRELRNTLTYMLAVREDNNITLEDIPDKGFFQGVVHYEYDDKNDLDLDKEQIFILKKIYYLSKEGEIIGREKLGNLTMRTEYEMTQYQMRSRLDKLERRGLIVKKKGKHGTVLSNKGKKIVMELLEEMGG